MRQVRGFHDVKTLHMGMYKKLMIIRFDYHMLRLTRGSTNAYLLGTELIAHFNQAYFA